MRERLLVIGNGMAGVRLVEAVLRHDAARFAITVVGAEVEPGYNRVLLSALLAGEVGPSEIVLRERSWYAERDVNLITGDAVACLDVVARVATLASGRAVCFDQCVFATGSVPIRLPLPGMDKPGVMTFRDLGDVGAMERAASAGARVAVIGGGLLGIEAAHGLARIGAKVTLIHVMDRLMERQLDPASARLLARSITRKGVKVLLGRQTAEIAGSEAAEAVVMADGERIAADLVVCAVGIRPNASLAEASGLAVQRGIVVDDQMAASLPGFHAVGECAAHRGVACGLVEPAYAQAEVLARRLCGLPAAFEGVVPATNLKVSGVPVFSAGDIAGGGTSNVVMLEDAHRGIHKRLVIDGNRLVGCVLVGEAEDGLWYLDLIRRGVDISAVRQDLIHGRSFCAAIEATVTAPLQEAA